MVISGWWGKLECLRGYQGRNEPERPRIQRKRAITSSKVMEQAAKEALIRDSARYGFMS